MCGRYSLTSPPEVMRRLFGLTTTPNYPARYNIAPTQLVPVVRRAEVAGDAVPEFAFLRWGLVPGWASDLSIGARMINARAETVREKPAYRAAYRQRRCLVPADGFYEWKAEGKAKQPVRITLDNGELFAFAGLWEHWKGPEGPVASFTIITTVAATSIAAIHERMPVILDPTYHGRWLDPRAEPDALDALLRPFPSDRLKATPVSTRVNSVKNDDEACLAPMATQGALL